MSKIDAGKKLLDALERMPRHAWLKRRTWAKLLRDNKPDFQRGNKLVKLVNGVWHFDPGTQRRFPTIPRSGRIDSGGKRFYLVPAIIGRDVLGNERMALFDGSPVWLERVVETATNEIMALIGPADLSDPEPLRWEIELATTNLNAKYGPLIVYTQLNQFTQAPPTDTLPLYFA
jgi:hypothetical protein